MSVLPYVSLAVIVTEPLLPAVRVAGVAESTRVAAAAGVTVIAELVPVTEPLTVSVALTVREPTVVRM